MVFLHQPGKRIKTKSQTVFGANSYVCISYRGKTGRGVGGLLLILNRAKGIRLITRLPIELSHLREYKFRCNFQNCLNLLCSYGSSIESTSDFRIQCPVFDDKRHTLLSTLNNTDCKILQSTDSYLTQW